MADFTYPERLSLARLPTPVQRLDRLSEELGVNLLVKRDDLTGMELSGNKIRKLEFVLAEALARDSTAVLTTGGWQSNHCRATAVAAVGLGLRPHLLLHTVDGEPPAEPDGNHLLDLLVGADIRYITAEQFPGLPGADDVTYDMVDEFKGIGYALSTAEELTFLRDCARADGLILDPMYSGKAFRGLVEELRRGERFHSGSTVLFVHTGGLFGLFPKRNELVF